MVQDCLPEQMFQKERMVKIRVQYSDLFVKIQLTLVISNSKGLTEILRDIHTSTYQS